VLLFFSLFFPHLFFPKILDPMWEVLHLDVLELDSAGGSRVLGVAEVPCGEMVANLGAAPKEYALETPPDASKPADLTGCAIVITTNQVRVSGNVLTITHSSTR
jgi:hypothetical protein